MQVSGTDTTTERKFTTTAVIIGHEDREALIEAIQSVYLQTLPPDEVIACVCCMSPEYLVEYGADIVVNDKHQNDVGQRFCDYGLKLASKDYVWFYSSDDYYDDNWLASMQVEPTDIILGGFDSRLVGRVEHSQPIIGQVTRGSFLVRREFAQKVGYNGREYSSDGQFIRDLVEAGASHCSVDKVLYKHN